MCVCGCSFGAAAPSVRLVPRAAGNHRQGAECHLVLHRHLVGCSRVSLKVTTVLLVLVLVVLVDIVTVVQVDIVTIVNSHRWRGAAGKPLCSAFDPFEKCKSAIQMLLGTGSVCLKF